MARTERREPTRFYSHETSWARKFTRRLNRTKAKAMMENGQYEQAGTRVAKGTSGWLSW